MDNMMFMRQIQPAAARTILVTGSYGKTNCLELIRQILMRAGYSVSDCGESADFSLLHVDFTELAGGDYPNPDLAVITNISSYPLKGYRRYRDLLADIHDFISGLLPGTVVVENQDYKFLRDNLGSANDEVERVLFRMNGELSEGVWVSQDQEIMLSREGGLVPVVRLSELLLQGERNLGIYLAAIAATKDYADPEVIREVCLVYAGHSSHFCCYRLDRGRRLYMQLNTGLPSLAEAAFVGFSEKLVIVTGRIEETEPDQPYQGLALMLSAYAKRLILFGPDRELIEYAVRKIGVKKSYDLPVIKKETADAALRYAADTAGDGEWILFTPVDYIPGLRFDLKKMKFEKTLEV